MKTVAMIALFLVGCGMSKEEFEATLPQPREGNACTSACGLVARGLQESCAMFDATEEAIIYRLSSVFDANKLCESFRGTRVWMVNQDGALNIDGETTFGRYYYLLDLVLVPKPQGTYIGRGAFAHELAHVHDHKALKGDISEDELTEIGVDAAVKASWDDVWDLHDWFQERGIPTTWP